MSAFVDSITIASDPSTPVETLLGFADDSRPEVQQAIARNPNTPQEVLQRLWEKYPACILENPILAFWEFTKGESAVEFIEPRTLLSLYNHLHRQGAALPEWIFKQTTLLKLAKNGLSSLDPAVFEYLPYEIDPLIRLQMLESRINVRLFEFFQTCASDEIWDHFATDPNPDVRVKFANLLRSSSRDKVPPRIEIISKSARQLARDERYEIQEHLANCRFLPPDIIEKLSCSPDSPIRVALTGCLYAPLAVQEKLARDSEEIVRVSMSKNSTSSAIHDILIRDPSLKVRKCLAENLEISVETLRKFNLRDHPDVIKRVFQNRSVDQELRIKILEEAVPEVQEVLLEMGKSLTPKFYRKIKPLIYGDILSKLGMAAGLHRDIVEDLASDPLPEVRLAVARRLSNHHNNAAHAKNVALVNAFACDADARVREQVCTDRRLNKSATAVLFGDPDPRVRKKALRSVLDQLVYSKDARHFSIYRYIYRQKAAFIVKLARDSDHLIRDLIANCPEAPPAAMNILFNDPETFIRDAVRNTYRWPYGVMLDLVKKEKTNSESLFHGTTTPSTRALRLLADSPNPFIRTLVARCKRTPLAELRKLSCDRIPAVRAAANQRLSNS